MVTPQLAKHNFARKGPVDAVGDRNANPVGRQGQICRAAIEAVKRLFDDENQRLLHGHGTVIHAEWGPAGGAGFQRRGPAAAMMPGPAMLAGERSPAVIASADLTRWWGF
jgi:hypothetical protein